MRLLFASSSGSGHFLPLVPWIDAAVARGHEVLVLGPAGLADRAGGYRFTALDEPDPERVGALWARAATLPPGQGAAFVMAEIFTRSSSGAMLDGAREVLADFRPDVVVREPMEFGSATVAAETGTPQIRVAIGLSRLEDRFLGQASPVLEEFGAGTTAAVAASPYLTAFPASLDPGEQTRYRAAGPAPAPYRADWGHPEAPLLYATFGTEAPRMAAMVPLYQHTLAALADLPVRVLMTVGRELDPTRIGAVPDNARVLPWVDQAAVLANAALVLHHGGSGTTLGALAAGCPQVVFPLFADQPANARAVAEAGVGLGLRDPGGSLFRTLGDDVVGCLHEAVGAALGDARLRVRAAEVAAETASLPTLTEVAARVFVGW